MLLTELDDLSGVPFSNLLFIRTHYPQPLPSPGQRMKCPKCQFENPDGMRFCGQCAHSLTISQEPTFAGPTYEERLERIQRYLPRGITDKVLAQRDKIEGERKQVTVMFCDMAGFTPLVEELGSDEAYSVMDRVYDILIHCVHDYEGTVNEMTGDGIMALFGAPIALEDAPQRALRSALSIQREMLGFDQEDRTQSSITPIKMRIGIHTGSVVVGTLGNDLRVEFKAVGDTVNLASRMEGLAQPGTIYVSHETFRLTKELFWFEALGGKEFKGKKGPIPVYKLLSSKEDVYRPRLGAERIIYSEMVGRQKDLARLELQIMKAVNGEGSVVNIVGEAGIGKSRLVAELKKRDVMKDVTLLEGRAISMGKNLSFHPIIDFLKQWAGIREHDTEASTFSKLETRVRVVCPEEIHEVLPFVGTLMGMKLTDRYSKRIEGIEGEALQKLILKNVKYLLIMASELAPLVIVTEDMHWADISSIELLESLFGLTETHRIAFVNVFRPGHKETGDRITERITKKPSVYYVEITLEPLDEKMGETLINNMLRTKKLSHQMIDQIVERSGGNPFFIEEVVRSFLDAGAIVVKDGEFEVTESMDTMVIPHSITEVLTARIDRLEEKTRELLRLASVIGRSFFYRILVEVATTIEDINKRLSYLEEIQLIRQSKRTEELQYLFKHALAQETAYESILQSRRKQLHLQVGDTIERVFKDQLHNFYGMLAYHYGKGEEERKAEEYLIKAGEEALKSSAPSEALHYYQEALSLYLKKYGHRADHTKVAFLEKNIAFAYHAKGQDVEALEYFERALAFYGVKSPRRVVSMVWAFGTSFFQYLVAIYLPFLKFRGIPTEKDKELIDLLLKKMEALAIVNFKRFLVETFSFCRTVSRFEITKVDKGVTFFLATSACFYFSGISFKLGRKVLDQFGKRVPCNDYPQVLNYCLLELTYDLVSGAWHKAEEYEEDLVNQTLLSGDLYVPSAYTVFYGVLECCRGRFEKTQQFVDKLSEIADAYEYAMSMAFKYYLNALLLMNCRKLSAALEELAEGIAFSKRIVFKRMLFSFYAFRARVLAMLKDTEGALQALASAEEYTPEVRTVPFYLTDLYLSEFILSVYRLEDSLTSEYRPEQIRNYRGSRKIGLRAVRICRKTANDCTETLRLMGTMCWLVDKQGDALSWWNKSIEEGERLGALPELSRSYMEIGKRLLERKSKYSELKGISAKEYLEKARKLFTDMDLQWDLDELDKVLAYK